MEIVNSYEDTIAYYRNRVTYAEEELMDAVAILKELESLAASGWNSKAGNEMILRVQELCQETNQPRNDMDEIRSSLSQLNQAIEEEVSAMQVAAAAGLLF